MLHRRNRGWGATFKVCNVYISENDFQLTLQAKEDIVQKKVITNYFE